MSAFLVSRTHIAAIVDGYHRLVKMNSTEGHLADVGQVLWEENVASLRARYPNEENPDVTYGAHKAPKRSATPGELGQHLRCLNYQSCEHEGWEKSTAHRLLRLVAWALLAELPGFADAKWGLDDY